jgi:hypothetical protein
MLQFPTFTDSDYTQTFVVENVAYDFRFQFNPREAAWYCYLGLSGLDPKVKFKIVNGSNLIKSYNHYEEVPNGSLRLVDTVAQNGRVGRDDFDIDGRFVLVYLTVEEEQTIEDGGDLF